MTPKPLKEFEDDQDNSNHSGVELDSKTMEEAVVMVTPYSTGCCLALDIQKKGYKLICLWSAGFSEVMKTHVPVQCKGRLVYDAVLDEQKTLAETATAVNLIAEKHGLSVVSVICGGEAGVDLADALSEYMGFVTNGTAVPNRRDKKVQQELVRAAGLRSVRQAAGFQFCHVRDFLLEESYPVIVKPLDSAGSDGVKLCRTFAQAEEHFHYLMEEHDMVNGGTCHEVLCQEFLKGKEYVVDHVSRDGVHKTVMVWVYDKGSVNGADFVYFGDIPIDSESPEAKALIPYVRGVLDAMDIKNGPTHCEVIITEDGPCLVEMNCRAHGGDGNWRPLCSTMNGGYDQVDASVYAYLDKEKFDSLPDKSPSPFKIKGQCVDMVSYTQGTVKTTPGYDVIKQMPSYVHLETGKKPGSKVFRTVDLATDIGSVVLMNSDEEVLARDISMIRKLERDNAMFEFEEDEEWKLKRQQMLRKPCSLDFVMNNKTLHQRELSQDIPTKVLM